MFKSGTLEEVISDIQTGVYDFTCEGQCSNCGACCSNFLPVSAKELKAIRQYVKKQHIQECKNIIPTNQPFMDWTCPFRDNKNRRCSIYPRRPAICRGFKCDKTIEKIEADKALYHGKYAVVNMRKEFFCEVEEK